MTAIKLSNNLCLAASVCSIRLRLVIFDTAPRAFGAGVFARARDLVCRGLFAAFSTELDFFFMASAFRSLSNAFAGVKPGNHRHYWQENGRRTNAGHLRSQDRLKSDPAMDPATRIVEAPPGG